MDEPAHAPRRTAPVVLRGLTRRGAALSDGAIVERDRPTTISRCWFGLRRADIRFFHPKATLICGYNSPVSVESRPSWGIFCFRLNPLIEHPRRARPRPHPRD